MRATRAARLDAAPHAQREPHLIHVVKAEAHLIRVRVRVRVKVRVRVGVRVRVRVRVRSSLTMVVLKKEKGSTRLISLPRPASGGLRLSWLGLGLG